MALNYLMPRFALNHMTTPKLTWRDVVRLAGRIGCAGVEFRNDLPQPLFGDNSPEEVRAVCADEGIEIFAIAEVPCFNDATPAVIAKVDVLARLARRADAGAIALIPRIGGPDVSFEQLCEALDKIGGILAGEGVRGLIEPLGFAASTLRDFDVAREAILATHGADRFGIVHDTFHKHLSGGGAVRADLVDMVHVSGVTVSKPAAEMDDADRGLVDAQDRLGNDEQIRMLYAGGYDGPVSMEAFSPDVHALTEPEAALRASFDFIHTSIKAHAA